MLDFTYENQGVNTYLVYKVEENNILDNVSLGMLTNNKIPGLSSALFTQMNDDKFIKYNISSKVSAKQLFYGTVNRKRLLSVFKGIVDTMLTLDDYMIDVNLVLLNLDYIFVDLSTYEVSMICLPVSNITNSVSFYDFIKNIMFSTQFEQSENCDYVTKIINFLNATPTFSPSSFKQLIDGLLENGGITPIANIPVRPVTTTSVPPVTNITPSKVEIPVVKPTEPAAKSMVPPITKKESYEIPNPGKKENSEEKEISLFYLLQHYNAENAAAYKAQKEAKKQAGKKSATPTKTKPAKSGGNVDMGFAIPGQQTPMTPTPVAQPTPQAAPAAAPVAPVAPASQFVNKPAYPAPNIPQGQSMNFGETTVLGGGGVGETTVLGTAPTAAKAKPHLVRIKNNEKINLDKPVFRIGKEKSYVDYFIGDNSAISRSHANIITRDGEYFIVDTNSTNHTYVNGGMLQSNVETKLSHDAKVKLANEEFEFKIY